MIPDVSFSMNYTEKKNNLINPYDDVNKINTVENNPPPIETAPPMKKANDIKRFETN